MKLWETDTLCENCLASISSNVLQDGKDIYLEKHCKNCNQKKPTLTHVSSNSEYYLMTKEMQRSFSPRKKGSITILEITDDCNMKCPTCISNSYPGAGNYKSFDQIVQLIDSTDSSKMNSEILMISGGEPTIHPQIEQILRYACCSNFEFVMLITNGVKIANDKEFADKIKEFKYKLEVYLQFDSCRNDVLKELRGEELFGLREVVLDRLNSRGIATTLVCVVKKGLNDDEMSSIIEFALTIPCVRGVTFQPIRETGRHNSFTKSDSISLSEVVDKINSNSRYFKQSFLKPHPVNPSHIAIGYLDKSAEEVVNVTDEMFRSHSKLKEYMYFLPSLSNDQFSYDTQFRVCVIEFMDKFNFDYGDLEFCNVYFIEPDGTQATLEEHYLGLENRNSQSKTA